MCFHFDIPGLVELESKSFMVSLGFNGFYRVLERVFSLL